MFSDRTDLTMATLARRIEEATSLDPLVERIDAALPDSLREGIGRKVLSGYWMGHSAHPLLTDLPIGFWTSATALDALGRPEVAPASRRLVALGILASLPTVASGWSDWTKLDTGTRRVGVVHATCNAVALACYTASYLARRKDPENPGKGKRWGYLGAMAMGAGGFLGADLSLNRAVTRDNRLLPSR